MITILTTIITILQVCCSSPLLVIARAARGGNVELLALEAAIGPYGAVAGAVAARRLGKNGGIPWGFGGILPWNYGFYGRFRWILWFSWDFMEIECDLLICCFNGFCGSMFWMFGGSLYGKTAPLRKPTIASICNEVRKEYSKILLLPALNWTKSFCWV